MNKFEITILGSNSALPAYGRFPTSQILDIGQKLFLIDCGEGTQIRLGQYKIKRNKISHIFISHLHGDHLYGLPGVIISFNHTSRKEALTIFGPVGLKQYIDTCFEVSQVHLNFQIDIVELSQESELMVLETEQLTVHAFPVNHRVPTFGYRFQEKDSPRNIRKDAIKKYNLSLEQILNAKKGVLLNTGDINYKIEDITHPKANIRSYAYCADSRYDEQILPFINEATVLYFETTYLDVLKEEAFERGHATARQAGIMAKKAGVRTLITGHYSSRYKILDDHLIEAKSEFDNVVLGYDGLILNVEP